MTNTTLSITGLGYVGLPAALAFANTREVIGFDIDETRISELRRGYDRNNECSTEDLNTKFPIHYTSNPGDLSNAAIHLITVPTPVNSAHIPNISLLIGATRALAKVLKKGDAVIFESSVYPGLTEERCIPILESLSGLKVNVDFWIGYSPERINPGDRKHTFSTTSRIVSASCENGLNEIYNLYSSVISNKIHKAPNIKVAELAKILENTQRDVNIGLMNDIALICHKLEIDTGDVLDAAGSKWNFLPFTPGLVGGHCIGVDPYYLAYQGDRFGQHLDIILASRRTNEGVGIYIANEAIKYFNKRHLAEPTVAILGFTFKENVADTRNTRVFDIYSELRDHGINVKIADCHAVPEQVKREYNIELSAISDIKSVNAVILAVGHDEYVKYGWKLVSDILSNDGGLVIDVKHILERKTVPAGVDLWRL